MLLLRFYGPLQIVLSNPHLQLFLFYHFSYSPKIQLRFSCFLHFLLGQLHDECKWPSTLSISSSQHEDSPLMRIFGGLIRLNSRTSKAPRRVDRGPETISAFLLLHLDLTESGDGGGWRRWRQHILRV